MWSGCRDAGYGLIEFTLGNRLMQIVGNPDALEHIGIEMAAHGTEHNDVALLGLRHNRELNGQRYTVHIRHLGIQQDQRPVSPFAVRLNASPALLTQVGVRPIWRSMVSSSRRLVLLSSTTSTDSPLKRATGASVAETAN